MSFSNASSQKVFIALAALLVLLSTTQAQTARRRAQNAQQRSLNPREIARRSLPSVVLLLTEDARGNPIALGSGFFVEADVIATNFHVIEDASHIYVKIPNREGLFSIIDTLETDEERDLAILKIAGIKARPLRIGDSKKVAVGDEVYVVGSPEGLEGTFSQGIVSAIRGEKYIQISAPISHGSSGGPVLNNKGEVIGVAVGLIEQGQNLNFAVPSFDLDVLLLMSAVDKELNLEPTHVPKSNTGKKAPELSTLKTCVSDSAEIYCSQALKHFVNGNEAEAVEKAKQSVQIEPTCSCLASIYVSLGRHDEAIEAYEQLKRLNPKDKEIHFRLGDEYLEVGRYQEAAEAYQQDLRVNPDKAARAYIELGVVYGKQGRVEEQEEYFRKALRAKPITTNGTYHLIASAYSKLGQYEQAISWYREYIALNPSDDHQWTYTEIGMAYAQLGRYQEAIEAYQQAIKIKPFSLTIYYLGVAYLKVGKRELALGQYRLLMEINEDMAKELFELINK